MKIEDIIKLVDAGFKAEQIAQMYAAEKIEVPEKDQATPPPMELSTPITTPETQQTPISVPAESPKVEEAPEDHNTELEDLKRELAESKASVSALQGIMASFNVGESASNESVDDYLHKAFADFY
jgi:outer membrane biosynthesis protein TonB